MNLQEIKELLKLITESNIQEFELERAGIKLKIKKANSLSIQSVPSITKLEEKLPPETKPEETPAKDEEKTDNLYIVKSPMVGTFYRSPSSDASPYIEEGEEVILR